MNSLITKLSAAVVVLFALGLSESSAQEAEWSFVGTWRMNVTCGDYKMVNTVRVSTANATEIDGTTNVDDGFGEIVSGKFDGKNVTFVNTFIWDGKKHKEIWKGVLSKKGRYFKGKFSSTLNPPCSFYGSLK
jgi:hypothetical protein